MNDCSHRRTPRDEGVPVECPDCKVFLVELPPMNRQAGCSVVDCLRVANHPGEHGDIPQAGARLQRIKPGFLVYDEGGEFTRESVEKLHAQIRSRDVRDFWQVPVGARFPALLQKAWDFVPTTTVTPSLPVEMLNPFRLVDLDNGKALLRRILKPHLPGVVLTTRAVQKSTMLPSQRVAFKAGRQLGKWG